MDGVHKRWNVALVTTTLVLVVMSTLTTVAALTVAEGGARAEEHSRRVKASAYNSTVAQTDSNPNEGAWGDTIIPGMQVIAVSRDLQKLGLGHRVEVRIEGLPGTWRVLDRTASRHRNRIDIYMGTDVQAALEWGIREVVIHWSD
jgi:3D (Asp-Asp-Asp) domain-containing protein